MVSFILRITSQVEHTKKHSRIESESKSVKQNTIHQNCLTVFLHVTLVLPYSKKNIFGLNRMLWCLVLTESKYSKWLVESNFEQVDILISKNQALQILYFKHYAYRTS